jgi:hypothetical protein
MRESRLSGSVEGVVSDHDSYSDFPQMYFCECFLQMSGALHFLPISRRVKLSCWRINRLLFQEFRDTFIPVHSLH